MTQRPAPRLFSILFAIGLAAVAGCAPQQGGDPFAPETAAVRDAGDARIGREVRPEILARFGGAYTEGGVQAYVERVGRRVAAVSEQPQAPWSFTVLDTPTVNAFATPGGYIYVTRGLVALANDEAELAGVLAHEIGHVTAGHSTLRRDRAQAASLGALIGGLGLAAVGLDPGLALQIGQVAAGGLLADYSRSDELAADSLGVRYIAAAGYDPEAQADFLASMGDFSALQARIAGERYDPNRVDFFASHPANAERTRGAIRAARAAGEIVATDRERGRERFLSQIDGMLYGDSPEQGFVDGRRFAHPRLRFAFEVPPGYTIRNTTQAVVAAGPQNGRFVFDGVEDPGGPAEQYLLRAWIPAIGQQTRTGQPRLTDVRRIGGREAAQAVLLTEVQGRPFATVLTVVRHGGTLYRMIGLTPQGSGGLTALADAARSFRPLSAAEAGRLAPRRIRVTTVQPGDSVAGLAREMAAEGEAEALFRVLNDLDAGERLTPGQRVKLVRQ